MYLFFCMQDSIFGP